MKCLDVVRTNLLVILTMVGVAFGFVVGFVAREYNPSASALMWIGKYIYIKALFFICIFAYNFPVITSVCVNIRSWCACTV